MYVIIKFAVMINLPRIVTFYQELINASGNLRRAVKEQNLLQKKRRSNTFKQKKSTIQKAQQFLN
jgi:hypothetical protein